MHCYYFQRTSSKEEALNNKVERMTRPADISESPSPAIPLLEQWACKCGTTDAGKEAVHELTIMGFYSARLLVNAQPASVIH